ncbi:HAD family hydrolase [Clavibacter tessellarius]|uniref:HAD family hydrolase n=1 Tax=Clavibacter tessellarius TaxID=31965 RepID=UPI00324FD5F8
MPPPPAPRRIAASPPSWPTGERPAATRPGGWTHVLPRHAHRPRAPPRHGRDARRLHRARGGDLDDARPPLRPRPRRPDAADPRRARRRQHRPVRARRQRRARAPRRASTGSSLDGSPATVEIPGARDLVAALPAASHALVTSAGPALARARLAGAGIRVPDVVVSADDVTAGKPDPSGYLLAAERLGVDPSDAIVYEDAEAGIRAGLAAGMRVVVVGDHASDATVGLPACATIAARRSRRATGSSR